MAEQLPEGVRRTTRKGRVTGYQAYIWVPDASLPKGGFQASHRFPTDTPISKMKAWRQERRLRATHPDLFVPVDPAATTFAEEARLDYLQREAVKAMPTYDERVRHIEEWIAEFGPRDRHTIEPQEIQAVLDRLAGTRWQKVSTAKNGRTRVTQSGTYSAGSINKRRTALMDLWTTLDGRHQANPVKATREEDEPQPEPRAPSITHVLRILKAMPPTKTRARLKVIAWTGWPHATLKRIQETDLDFKARTATVPGRKKGKGTRTRVLPLLPQAIAALKELRRVEGFGWFSNSSMHSALARYCKNIEREAHRRGERLDLSAIRPYDFRHFFGTLVAIATKDERAVMHLMMLNTVQMARRYTEAATDPRAQAAIGETAGKLRRWIVTAEREIAKLEKRGGGRIGRIPRSSGVLPGPPRSRAVAERGRNR